MLTVIKSTDKIWFTDNVVVHMIKMVIYSLVVCSSTVHWNFVLGQTVHHLNLASWSH